MREVEHETPSIKITLDQPLLVTFIIPLPSPVGIVHGSTVTVMRDERVEWLEGTPIFVKEEIPHAPLPVEGGNFVSFKFWRPKRDRSSLLQQTSEMMKVMDAITGSDSERPSSSGFVDGMAGTVVEVVTPVFGPAESDFGSALSVAFDRGLEELTDILRAIRVWAYDPKIPMVGRSSVPASIPYVVRALNFRGEFFNRHTGLLLVNDGTSLQSDVVPDISADDISEVLTLRNLHRRGDVFVTASDQFQRGMRSYWMEADYQGAVVSTYTAIEMFCNGLLGLLHWEGHTPIERFKEIMESGLSTRLRTSYHPLLGGNWNPNSESSVLHQVDQAALVRHRIVHTAYNPTYDEIHSAFAAYQELVDFVKRRLCIKRFEYPRTAMMLLGRPGMERLGGWTTKFQQWIEPILEEADWRLSYRSWREQQSPN